MVQCNCFGGDKIGFQNLNPDGYLRNTGGRERLEPARGGGPTRRGRRVGLAPVGRVVLWAFVGLVLIRGLGAIFGSGEAADRSTAAAPDERRFPDDEARPFAVRFAHTYLGGSS